MILSHAMISEPGRAPVWPCGLAILKWRPMGRRYTANSQVQRFEIGDAVIGDQHIHGTIIKVNELCPSPKGRGRTVREYLVRSDKGERLVYAGEANLQLVEKGRGDAAPPSPELLRELEEDLSRRPLVGLRL